MIDRDLEDELGALVADAEAALDTTFGTRDVTAVALLTLDELQRLERGDPRIQELCDLALRAADLEVAIREQGVQRRTRALAGVAAAFGRLRFMSTADEIVDSACRELVESCGFNRAMLSRVEGSTWTPWMAHFGHRELRPSDREWMATTRIPLRRLMLEREMLETRRPAYVADAPSDRRIDPQFMADTAATSYVAAPVIPEGRVIGFLHADHFPTGRTVDRIDRDILGAFAEGFGRLYERAVLAERLTTQRDHVRETLRNAEAIMDKLARGEVELARREEQRSMAAGATALAIAGERSALDELLTPREREVLSLIVVGQSNSAIATRLVISEGTVKSHVKQILRKIGAANRSEAIARYLGMIGGA